MAQYLSGSVTVTNGSPTVTGVSTLFTANVSLGDVFSLLSSGVFYTVAAIDSDLQITLSANYAGATATAQPYTITRDFTPILGLPYPVTGDVDTAGIVKEAMLKIDAGITVRSFNHKGVWLVGTTYAKDDAITNGGRYFISVVANNTGHVPPAAGTGDAWWGLISDRGVQGAQGIQGVVGNTGPQGIQGLTGNTGPQGIQGVIGPQGIQGATGQGFVINTIYDSVALLLAGAITDGEFGLVAGALPQTNPDYGRLYIYSGGAWTYITDMSVVGADGVQGPQGIQGITGSTGPQGIQGVTGNTGPQGIQGLAGASVDHTSRTAGTGAPGTTDIYTLWADAAETIGMGTFAVVNGANGSGAGDMTIAVYDPNAAAADAFSMTNMVEGATSKVLTATERNKLAGITPHADVTPATVEDQSNKDVANGYSGLDANDEVTKLPAGAAVEAAVRPTSAKRADGSWLVPVDMAMVNAAFGVAGLDAAGEAVKLPAGAGAAPAGAVLQQDGSWAVPQGGGSAWTVKTATYTAVLGDGIIGNTAAGPFTVTLPAIVAIGDSIPFIDFDGSWATNNLTIATTGANTIMGLASPMIVNSSVPFELVAISLTDWRLF